jgi:WD40 repeat protein
MTQDIQIISGSNDNAIKVKNFDKDSKFELSLRKVYEPDSDFIDMVMTKDGQVFFGLGDGILEMWNLSSHENLWKNQRT